ncbi:MAG: aldo/keto reductase, partial [Paludibacteraceae bacterium]|nr:aldo/keto reductase [Paludibacteraceae bacterium]
MKNNKKHKITRRSFLKLVGAGSVAVAASSVGCSSPEGKTSSAKKQRGQMTYRINPKTNDKVSLLGFGMMRLPAIDGNAAGKKNDSPIDQKQVNRLVDYAIENGVNYFDTSPSYCKGESETSTGIALHRHPRESYFIATKLSNFSREKWSRAASMEMYRNSFKRLQVDYIDYYLLHGVGMGAGQNGVET